MTRNSKTSFVVDSKQLFLRAQSGSHLLGNNATSILSSRHPFFLLESHSRTRQSSRLSSTLHLPVVRLRSPTSLLPSQVTWFEPRQLP